VSKLHGASYELEHCTSKAKDKKHASDLSPYPAELIPFRPLDGADNQFGQLNRKFKEHPYKEAGITGFIPPTPFVVPAQFLTTDDSLQFAWPTLAELNEEFMSELGIDVPHKYQKLIYKIKLLLIVQLSLSVVPFNLSQIL
jgi:hypothetical protein